ncbi:E3 ubiquitin-protein ligase TRIM7-like isoform X2 [Hemicordylus capensis]|nr:E3 ubiquitin-protein ligase TRIM7-like isoform X2 [Hemicordylus capensis]XP_053145630.1 E3 ubiquitin-protein ligase TRIM7-like isoform X2 [Hemicordylus capensis]
MDRKNCLLKKAKAETESQELLKQTDHEREVFVSELKHLQDFLEGYQDCFLEKLTIVENKVNCKSREFMAELTKDLDFLKKASEELERRCLLPKTQLLQDVGHALPMYTQEIRKMALPFELKWKSWDLLDTNYVLDDVLDQFKDVMSSALLQLEKVNVTLDLEGLHPQVVFSEDHQSMTWRRLEGLLGNLEQAGELSVVLGKEKLYFARYFWEVDVGSEEDWAVGVGTEYMDLEGIAISGPREGIWAFGKWMGKYRAVSPTEFTDVSLKGSPRRIRVCVNGGGERVSFLDADTAVLLYMLSLVIVPSEPFRPFFWVCNKGHLQLNPSGS